MRSLVLGITKADLLDFLSPPKREKGRDWFSAGFSIVVFVYKKQVGPKPKANIFTYRLSWTAVGDPHCWFGPTRMLNRGRESQKVGTYRIIGDFRCPKYSLRITIRSK